MVDALTILVVLFLIVTLIPFAQQRIVQGRRRAIIRDIETKRGSRMITLIHRQETMSLLGIPILRYIDINDSEEILRAVRLTPDEMPIDIIVHTPGGLVLSAEQIALALRRHPGTVTVFVPHYAMSGGTLLCLAADAVCMDENAVLGPVDPQLEGYPAASILGVIAKKEAKDIDDKTFILADVAQKAQVQVEEFVLQILEGRMDDAGARRLAATLTEGRWTHDYPITAAAAVELGLPVTTGLPAEIYELMDLFPQTIQRRPSVEYIPVPYRKEVERERPKRRV